MYLRDKDGDLKAQLNEAMVNYILSNNPSGGWGVSCLKDKDGKTINEHTKFTFDKDFSLRLKSGEGTETELFFWEDDYMVSEKPVSKRKQTFKV